MYECDDYDQVLGGVPFVRNAWAYDRFHELDLPLGELLLFALCAQPYGRTRTAAWRSWTPSRRTSRRPLALAELPEAG